MVVNKHDPMMKHKDETKEVHSGPLLIKKIMMPFSG